MRDASFGVLVSKLEDNYRKALEGSGCLALVDLPRHLNIGDSLIALGQILTLERIGKVKDLIYVGVEASEETLDRINEKRGTFLIHGGGNFGDLWPWHQQMRERLVRRCVNSKIVQLPQSIHFSSEVTRDESMKVFQAHPDFTLMVRDNESFQKASVYLPENVRLVPDSAFAIGHTRGKSPIADLVIMQRDDCEARFTNLGEIVSNRYPDLRIVRADWARFGDLPAGFGKRRLLEKIYWRFLRAGASGLPALKIWKRLFLNRLNIGKELLSMGKIVVTDRLHVHVLCSLLRKPHVFIDNNYGKISALANTWSTLGDFALSAYDESELIARVEQLRSNCSAGTRA